MSMAHAALESPDFMVTQNTRRFYFSHMVTCHMAAIYWAFRAMGRSQQQSRDALKAIVKHECPACNNRGDQHGSLRPNDYSRLFCGSAIPLDGNFMTGDVLIQPDRAFPMHSMVIVAATPNPRRPQIRGFNNQGTFNNAMPPPPHMRYDPVTRNVDARVNAGTNPLYYVKQTAFMRAALIALQAAGGH